MAPALNVLFASALIIFKRRGGNAICVEGQGVREGKRLKG